VVPIRAHLASILTKSSFEHKSLLLLNSNRSEFRTYLPIDFATVKGLKSPRNIVGPVVRELRAKRGLTQPQLVAKLNLRGWDISREILAKIEAQIRWVADFEIAKLASGLGVDPLDLLGQALSRPQKRRLP
jgi:hypothetical protein